MSEQIPNQPLRIIDVFVTDDPVIDKWTIVTNEKDPWTGYNTMLGTDETGRDFSQWTSGFYELGELNPHLGVRPRLIGEQLVNHVIGRLELPEGWK
jgi:hypothetical protein